MLRSLGFVTVATPVQKFPALPCHQERGTSCMVSKMLIFYFAILAVCSGAEWRNLWAGDAPGAVRPEVGTERVQEGWRFREVEVPQYFLYQPEKPNGQCVVILPGGGYSMLAGDHEGRQFGEWFAEIGITAMVVKYRVSGDDAKGYQFPVPLLDARRALRVARHEASAWNVDPEQIGVMGFSAGGHLASMCVTLFEETFAEEATDVIDRLSCRPAFGVLVYPVISMSKPHVHGGSKQRLLGVNPSSDLVMRVDTALRVTARTPPILIVHSADDEPVPLRNSLDFIDACAAQKVPITAHLFSTGGHGYGFLGRKDAEGWTVHLDAWMKQQFPK